MLTHYPDFPSQFVTPRNVDVWFPPDYDPAQRCPVLYMHDGQNLFNPASSYGGVTWGIEQAMTRLIEAGKIPPALVVGIWHPVQRWRDYMPRIPADRPDLLERFAAEAGGPPASDEYLKFLVTELKPFIDSTYSTLADRAHTTVMGSSMGGLISLFALEEYPHIFGGAGCLSTHWVVGGNLLVDALAAGLPPPGHNKIYFDYGTETLDAQYEPFQLRMDEHMRAAGYRRGSNWMTEKFPGAEHSEKSWRARVHIPLKFLLGKEER